MNQFCSAVYCEPWWSTLNFHFCFRLENLWAQTTALKTLHCCFWCGWYLERLNLLNIFNPISIKRSLGHMNEILQKILNNLWLRSAQRNKILAAGQNDPFWTKIWIFWRCPITDGSFTNANISDRPRETFWRWSESKRRLTPIKHFSGMLFFDNVKGHITWPAASW